MTPPDHADPGLAALEARQAGQARYRMAREIVSDADRAGFLF